MFTHEEVEIMLMKATDLLDELSIPYDKNTCPIIDFVNAGSWYGYCCTSATKTFLKKNPTCRGYSHYIRISEAMMQMSEKAVMNTLIHELIHTCPGCMNHGSKWQSYGNQVRLKFGYDIKRCGGDKDGEPSLRQAANVVYKHKVVCTKCGRYWLRTRDSNLTMYPESYHCCCGGDLKLEY